MGILETTGISVELRTPLWGTGDNTIIEDELDTRVTQLSTETSIDGGYLSASLSVELFAHEIDSWQNRLGYDLRVFNEAQQEIWRGFLNEISIKDRSFALTIGPLLDMCNHVKVQYQTMSYNTVPPIGGKQTETTAAQDAVSQGLYSTLQTILAGGQGLSAQMTELRDTYLEENKRPPSSQQLNLTTTEGTAVTLSFVGYGALMGRFYYTSLSTGTTTVSDKIIDIASSHPDLIFTTDGVESNTVSVPNYSDGSKTGLDEIKNIAALGGPFNNRYTFGVYGLRVICALVETNSLSLRTDEQYTFDLEEGYIETLGGVEVSPWDVKVGTWLNVTSFVVDSSGLTTDMRDDNRAIFVESAQYNAPDSVSVTGGSVKKLKQKIAKMGLGGM